MRKNAENLIAASKEVDTEVNVMSHSESFVLPFAI
jgi:hypothetical protein